MKRLFTKLAIIFLIIMAFFIIGFNKNVHASTVVDETIKPKGKIMKYNAITNETTEVNMEEVEQRLKAKGKKNVDNLNKLEPIYPKTTRKIYTPLSIFPPSNREEYQSTDTSVFPGSAICRATYSVEGGGSASGSAALVAYNLALTAAHCIWDEDNNNFKYINWNVHAGRNDSYYIGPICGWTEVYFSDNWKINHDPADDWALCVLGENVGENTGCFGAGSYYDNDLLSIGKDITSSGYPHKYGRQQWNATGKIDTLRDNYIVMTNIVTKGYSGGPITPTNNRGEIIGVIQGYNGLGFGIGARITDEMIRIISLYR